MNHFIEAYEDGMIAVHSGSRNLGLQVATHYQNLAIQRLEANAYNPLDLANIAPQDRQAAIQAHKENQVKTPKHLAWLEGQDMEDYIHDMQIINDYAFENRFTMLHNIATEMGGYVAYGWDCIHNYIDANRVLRKGAIAAKQDEVVLIPLNMKDGMICGTGKGNPDWNESAPHGAGRLYSRSAAKREFSLEDFQETMKGIHSTTIGQDTIDEAPFAYKNMQEILHAIGDTVRVNQILKPVYNFKSSET